MLLPGKASLESELADDHGKQSADPECRLMFHENIEEFFHGWRHVMNGHIKLNQGEKCRSKKAGVTEDPEKMPAQLEGTEHKNKNLKKNSRG